MRTRVPTGATSQLLPVFLTIVVCSFLVFVLWLEVRFLNVISPSTLSLRLRWTDVALGLVIYLKTSIDFALFIARLMVRQTGLRSRIAIELGTAFGNAAGTLLVLGLWAFTREIKWLLALMILVAALVLVRLAAEGLEHTRESGATYPQWLAAFAQHIETALGWLNRAVDPVLGKIVPSVTMRDRDRLAFWPLFGFAFTIPFILGLDDFAGYVPVFNVVNVFGFAVGVFVGHMLLNMLLYISPKRTVRVVQNAVVSLVGSLAFIGLAIWGIVEVVKLLA